MNFFKRLFGRNQEVVIDQDTSMNNVVDSMFLCKPLYDSLKVKCHPDRFLDEQKKEQAEALFQQLQKSRYNYQELQQVEQQINTFLQS